MSTIQDTIIRAVKVKGYRILEDKDALCVILEDLSPDLYKEREFIDKVYNNGVGKIILNACLSDSSKKHEYLKEADAYLSEENGLNEEWRRQLLSYFEAVVQGGVAVSFNTSTLMQQTVQKGQRVLLDNSMKMALVGFGCSTVGYNGGFDFSLDMSAFLLGENGKCLRDEDFIFYNNLSGRDHAVVYQENSLLGAGAGEDQSLIIDFSRIPDEIKKIAVCVTIYDAAVRSQNFGQVSNACIRVVKIANAFDPKGEEQLRFNLEEQFSVETALVVCEIYRYSGRWKFNAVAAGFQGGMEALLNNFGLSV